MRKKKNYAPPHLDVIELEQVTSILYTSPGGSGNQPPTNNDNSDNDW